MAVDERIRLEIAFTGGQTIGPIVSVAAADGLKAALDGDAGAYELEAEDGTYLIPLRAVMYVKRFSRETHIGFGRSG
jgi:hypothetical protein